MGDHRTIIRTVKNRANPYVQIHKGVFEDTRLSWKAKGLMGYFLSRPDDWHIMVRDLLHRSTDGRDSVYAGLRELKQLGYVQEHVQRDAHGRIIAREYWVYEQPPSSAPEHAQPLDPDFPDQAKPDQAKPDQGNPPLLTTDLEPKNELDQTTTQLTTEAVAVSESNASDSFDPSLWEQLRRLSGPRLARRWLTQYGPQRVAEVLGWIQILEVRNPGGFLRKALEEGWTEPAAVDTRRRRAAEQAARRRLQELIDQGRAAEDRRRAEAEAAVDAAIAALAPAERKRLEHAARIRLQQLTGIDPDRSPLTRALLPGIRREVYRKLYEALPSASQGDGVHDSSLQPPPRV